MKKFATLTALALAAITLSAGQANAQHRGGGHKKHRNIHRNHHQKHHGHGNHWNHHHRFHHGGIRRTTQLSVIRPIVVQPRIVTQPRIVAPVFFGPGHRHFDQRFHSLVLKNRLPLNVRWDNGRYWIQHQNNWIVYDTFVTNHCGGNWNWYLKKYRSKYNF